MSANLRREPAIRAVDRHDMGAFFAYLDDHLLDNGRDGAPLFQPMPRALSSFPLGIAVGEPGWRRAWVALTHDGILGHVDLRARPETGSSHRALLGMGVHRSARRQGLGAVLLQSALAWAQRTTTLDWVDLEVLSANVPARTLYQKTGFAVTGAIPDMFRIDGEALAYTLMSLRLQR